MHASSPVLLSEGSQQVYKDITNDGGVKGNVISLCGGSRGGSSSREKYLRSIHKMHKTHKITNAINITMIFA